MRRDFIAGCVLSAGVMATLVAAAGADEPPFTPPAELPTGWYARIDTTMGRVIGRLLPEQAPQAVAHFAAAAEGTLPWVDPITGEAKKGRYYDETAVYHVEAGRLFEAGDPTGTGRGAPHIHVPGDEGKRPVNFSRPHVLGMVRHATARTSGVQFFVTAAGMPWINHSHVCFGEVVAGKDVVLSLSKVKAEGGRPIEAPRIERIRIFKVGDPAPLAAPEAIPDKLARPEMKVPTWRR